jgi:hypothetical protein
VDYEVVIPEEVYAVLQWAGTREFLYRVYDPEVANRYMMDLVETGTTVRDFEFRMEHDDGSEHASYYLSHWKDESPRTVAPPGPPNAS